MSSLTQLINKFRGCLSGGLIGDCLGAPFEGEFPITHSLLFNFITKQLDETNKSFQIFPFTDDTAMTSSVAESLIQNKGFDPKDMSKRFTDEYFKSPKRGYGHNVVDVFVGLKTTNYERPYEPARMQFSGSGSYGNGGAMRISPIALFGLHSSEEQLIESAINCAKITHSNANGYNGAVLQCLAIHQALRTQVSVDYSFDSKQFLNYLIEKMEKIESNINDNNHKTLGDIKSKETPKPFTSKLKQMRDILENESQVLNMSAKEVAVLLGNDVSALKSVPTAIYSVIRAQNLLNDFESDNPFVRTLYYSLSLGGDTDTIGSMACSIAGALYGIDLIPNVLQRHCEDSDKILKYSDELYGIVSKEKIENKI